MRPDNSLLRVDIFFWLAAPLLGLFSPRFFFLILRTSPLPGGVVGQSLMLLPRFSRRYASSPLANPLAYPVFSGSFLPFLFRV